MFISSLQHSRLTDVFKLSFDLNPFIKSSCSMSAFFFFLFWSSLDLTHGATYICICFAISLSPRFIQFVSSFFNATQLSPSLPSMLPIFFSFSLQSSTPLYYFFLCNSQKQTCNILPIFSLARRHLLTFFDWVPETPVTNPVLGEWFSPRQNSTVTAAWDFGWRRADLGRGRRRGARGRKNRWCSPSTRSKEAARRRRWWTIFFRFSSFWFILFF